MAKQPEIDTGERAINSAPIIDGRAVQFVSHFTRPIAQALVDSYYAAKREAGFWNGGISTLIPNDAGSPISDGDTQAPVTGADVNGVVGTGGAAPSLISFMEANSNAVLNLLLKFVHP